MGYRRGGPLSIGAPHGGLFPGAGEREGERERVPPISDEEGVSPGAVSRRAAFGRSRMHEERDQPAEATERVPTSDTRAVGR